MTRRTTYLQMSLTHEEKEFIKNKANELNFRSVSAFLIESAHNHFRIDMDMSIYRKLTSEINYIGRNINSLIRKINSDGFYADDDIHFLRTNQKRIVDLMNKEYDRLLNLKRNCTSENLDLKEKENLIKALEVNQIDVPKKVVLEVIYEQIKDDFLYIGEAIESSPEQDEVVAQYFWRYLYGETLFGLEEKQLIKFADEIFLFTQKLKMKLLKLDNIFDNDDWYSIKYILNEYEIY